MQEAYEHWKKSSVYPQNYRGGPKGLGMALKSGVKRTTDFSLE